MDNLKQNLNSPFKFTKGPKTPKAGDTQSPTAETSARAGKQRAQTPPEGSTASAREMAGETSPISPTEWTMQDEMELEKLRKLQSDLEDKLDGLNVRDVDFNAAARPVIAAFNELHPGMDVEYMRSFSNMVEDIKLKPEAVRTRPLHYVVKNPQDKHTTVWRILSHRGEVVALGVETLNIGDQSFANTKENVQRLDSKGAVSRFALLPLNAQKDTVSCLMCDITILNAFYKKPDVLDDQLDYIFPPLKKEVSIPLPFRADNPKQVVLSNPIQKDALSGKRKLSTGIHLKTPRQSEIVGKLEVFTPEATEKLLPADMWMNAQSKQQLKTFGIRNPEKWQAPVSELGETIIGRLSRITSLDEKAVLDVADKAAMTRGVTLEGKQSADDAVQMLERRKSASEASQSPTSPRKTGFGAVPESPSDE